MSYAKPVSTLSDNSLWLYDGSFTGVLCCVSACMESGRMPLDIQKADSGMPSLLPVRYIDADTERAAQVRQNILKTISGRALSLVETVFLSCAAHKEILALRFLMHGFQYGENILSSLQNPSVNAMLKAERGLLGEAHKLTGFIRFSDHEGKLIAMIRPKNFVLPFLAKHFIDRYASESFMIYDRTHHAALLHEKGKSQIAEMESVAVYETSDEERFCRVLWKRFYETLSIEARYNPKCRMTHMPKRYWSEMTEMQEDESALVQHGKRPERRL